VYLTVVFLLYADHCIILSDHIKFLNAFNSVYCFSEKIKVMLCKTYHLPVLTYEAENWTLSVV